MQGAYGILMYVCGVRAVFLEDGGGALGITKVVSLHVQSIAGLSVCIAYDHMLFFFFLGERSGRVYTLVTFPPSVT